jgi:hypothetical protein
VANADVRLLVAIAGTGFHQIVEYSTRWLL